MRFLLLFFSLCCFSSCVSVEKEIALPSHSVYGFISPSDTLISIYVVKVYPRNQEIYLDSKQHLKDAKVYLIKGSDTLNLAFNLTSNSYEAANKNFVTENTAYQLLIQKEELFLSAQTFVPPSFEMKIDTLRRDNSTYELRVKWNKKNNETFYKLGTNVEFDVRYWGEFKWDSGGGFWETNDLNQHQNLITSPIGSFAFVPQSTVATTTTSLTAYNKESFDYLKNQELLDNRTEFFERLEPPILQKSNINGDAVGFFGAFTKSEMKINFKK